MDNPNTLETLDVQDTGWGETKQHGLHQKHGVNPDTNCMVVCFVDHWSINGDKPPMIVFSP